MAFRQWPHYGTRFQPGGRGENASSIYSYPQCTSKYQDVAIEGIKVDYYDANSKVIHEIKKSNKCDTAHEWQLKYYIYIFERNGIT